MKKKFAVVLAAIMMLSATTVLANPSIQTDVEVENAITSDGYGVSVNVDKSAQATTDLTQNLEAATDEVAESVVVTGEAEVEVEVVAMVSLTGTVPSGKTLNVTVRVAGAKEDEVFTVAHKKTSDGTWETLRGVSEDDGYVTIEGITEFSPFYIARVTVTPVAPAPQPETDKEESALPPFNANAWPWNEIIARQEAANAAQTVAPEATLPKTGAVAVLPVAAMACLAGAVVCGRKEK